MVFLFLKAILLGIINGLTEFLPVSSTAHLVILERLLAVSETKFGLSFDAAIHLGTAGAVFWFFWPTWKKIFLSFPLIFSSKMKEGKIWSLLILGTLPAAFLGWFFEAAIETYLRQPKVIVLSLIVGSLILYLAERLGKQKIKEIEKLNYLQALVIGLSQSLALFPGISRSGITLASAMFFSLSRKAAAEFAFLLSGPIILGAGGKKFFETLSQFLNGSLKISELGFFLVGIFASALSGWLVIRFLMRYFTSHSLHLFIFYRLILAFLVWFLIK